MTNCITFRSVVKSYGQARVLDDIDLVLPGAETSVIIGESGSGKSTLLQLVNGLIRPDSGSVEIFATPLDYTNLPALRRTMGYAVQGAGLFPHLTVRENVTLVAARSGWSEASISERFDFLVNLLDLPPDVPHRYPHSLSGGQQQRVSLCRAMMMNPPLMLLDEPFSALDPITRETIHDEFLRLQAAEARAIVLVTHDMSEALKLGGWLVILRDGRVVQEGEPAAVRAAPADDYVARLFAT